MKSWTLAASANADAISVHRISADPYDNYTLLSRYPLAMNSYTSLAIFRCQNSLVLFSSCRSKLSVSTFFDAQAAGAGEKDEAEIGGVDQVRSWQ